MTVESNGATISSGEYYLYNAQTHGFLTHGEYWGTCACVDKYGIPFYWDSEKESIKFLDNNLYLYEADPTYIYTDSENSTGFRFVEKGDGYCLQSLKTSAYLIVANGTYGLKTLTTTPNIEEAAVWQLKNKAVHDAMMKGYVAENYNHVIAASGITATSDNFVDILSAYKATDMTSSVGTNRFAGTAGDWIYNEVRAQNTQPAYGIDFCELWQATGSYTQTITGLPRGIYKVTMQGFERSGGYAQCNILGEKGYEITTAYLKANDEQVNLQSWYSGKSETSNPNNTAEAVAKFNEGKYVNELYTYVGADGKLTITVNKPSHVADNWILFNNFTLTYYSKKIDVTNIVLDKNSVTLTEGETIKLNATVSPENATDKTVTWTSSNTSVAIVNDGIVTAVSPGTATITAKVGDYTAKCIVNVVKSFVLGDVNGDNLIVVDDVVFTINHILGISSENFVAEAADMTGDGAILVDDVVQIINTVLGVNNANTFTTRSVIHETWNVSSEVNEQGMNNLDITLGHAKEYVAMQFDMTLPTNTHLGNIQLTADSNHSIVFNDMGNEVIRVLITSLTNEAFTKEDLLSISIYTQEDANIRFSNAYVATGQGRIVHLSETEVNTLRSETTRIQIISKENAPADVYDLSGRLVIPKAESLEDLQKGIYLINGKKIIVK